MDKGESVMREKERIQTSCISIYGLKPNREEGESRYKLTGLAICNVFFSININGIGVCCFVFVGRCRVLFWG
ncbi:hypothetical protein OFN37_39385, partial [Escherichia coli]|nr:hypothetical protein [Escherichia coli]